MRRGITLPELVLVLATLTLLLAIAIPRLATALDRVAVAGAAQRIAAAHARARAVAITQSAIVVLTVTPDSLRLARVHGADTARIWITAGPADDRVALTAPARPVVFGPLGLAIGVSNRTYRLSRGAATRAVVVSRLGRVRIQR